jgi:hypothetical protein
LPLMKTRTAEGLAVGAGLAGVAEFDDVGH